MAAATKEKANIDVVAAAEGTEVKKEDTSLSEVSEEKKDVSPETAENGQEEEEQPSYINVMQILVEEKADEYMKMFGICCCDKCRVDVRAYALNHLPPKYVVMSRGDRIPRLTVYESKYSSDITAQLLQACKVVMETPHHTRG